ncbi:MAG TPA: hypothetical protein VJR70_07220 [Stellaceae bacterium]|nr:hypothetical protein [Stellaceae bacterium]
MVSGGTIINHGTIDSAGSNAVNIAGTVAGTVSNFGVIENFATHAAIYSRAGGIVTNAAGALIESPLTAIAFNDTVGATVSFGTVDNAGTIVSTASGTSGAGVYFGQGGILTNRAGGLITAFRNGVSVHVAAGTVVNDGSILSTGAGHIGVYLRDGGTIENAAAISGVFAGVKLQNGGTVANAPSATITGGRYGVWAEAGAASVTNYGRIAATYGNGDGLFLYYGGSLTNAAGARVAGGADGVCIQRQPGTVANAGTIAGASGGGVELKAGGDVSNVAGGLISGYQDGVYVGGGAGSVANSGRIAGTGAGADGVALNLGGAVDNLGVVTGVAAGIAIQAPAQTLNIFSTGNGSTTDGYADPHWVFTNAAGVTSNALVANNFGVDFYDGRNGDGAWVPDTAASAWLVDNTANAQSGGNPLSFSTTFDLSGLDPATASLSGTWAVDDQALLELNGNIIASLTAPGSNWNTSHAFSVSGSSGFFLPGVNTLSVVLTSNDNFFEGANVAISGSAAPAVGSTVTNSGAVAATGASGTGIYLGSGGLVTNSGTVSALADSNSIGVNLVQGGTFVNDSGGIVQALGDAVVVSGAVGLAGTVANYGQIAGGGDGVVLKLPGAAASNYGTIVGTANYGVYLYAGNAVNNAASGVIEGRYAGVIASHAAGTVINNGTIAATGANGSGVDLTAGGSVTNQAGGLIEGAYDAVRVTSGAGAVSNLGTIAGTGTFTDGVFLFAGGSVINGAAGVTTALIEGTGRRGVFVYGGAGTVTNFATIASLSGTYVAVYLKSGGSVTNYQGGLLQGAAGIAGIAIANGSGNVNNYGSISGIYLRAGGVVINRSTGIIAESATAVSVAGGAGTIVNAGLISASGAGQDGVDLNAGGTVINSGTIDGGAYAVRFAGAGNLLVADPGAVFVGGINGGGGGSDVLELAAGSGATGSLGGVGSSVTGFDRIAVDAGATWQLTGGATLAAGATLTDAGRLTVAGAFLDDGTVDIGNSAKLTLAGGSGGSGGIAFTGTFGTLEIDGTSLPSNAITGFAAGDTIDLPNILGNTVSYSGGVLTLRNGATVVAQLTVATTSASPTFVAAPDGFGGTAITLSTVAHPFDFVFTYADGKDYYYGAVADDGSFGYRTGETIATSAGQYLIYAEEGFASPDAPGTVRVAAYSHSGPGEASPVPVLTAAGQADGTAGLGSEADAVLGSDGLSHPFSSTSEANFPTVALYGFVYTYADGAAFYTGSVADDGSFGTTVGSRAVTDSAGNLVGSYTIFAEGTTGRPNGTVTVERFTAGGLSLIPTTAGGAAGLGSESGTFTLGGTNFPFSDLVEPQIPAAIAPVNFPPPPSTADVITAEVIDLYEEVLGRDPDASGLATFSAALAGGLTVAAARTILAQSPEAQADLDRLYGQILNRSIDPSGSATFTAALEGGASLGGIQLILAQSPEATNDINKIYQEVLARDADGSGLVTYMGALAQGIRLAEVRSDVATSPEARNDLTALVLRVTGSAPSAAQLANLEGQLTQFGTSQQSLNVAPGVTSGMAVVTAGLGDASFTALPATPTLFVFQDIAFGHDSIASFDPTLDAVQLSSALAPDFATVQRDLSASPDGALLTLNPSQSILLGGVAPASLTAANFPVRVI